MEFLSQHVSCVNISLSKHSPLLLPVLLSILTLVILAGCKEEDPFDKLTNLDNTDNSVSASPSNGLLPDLSKTENLGNTQVGQTISLEETTQDSGIDFTYRNGRDAGNNSILESLGGGVASGAGLEL